jgi:hypothetical protein
MPMANADRAAIETVLHPLHHAGAAASVQALFWTAPTLRKRLS